MPMKRKNAFLIALLFAAMPGHADWTDARCDIYPKGEDHTKQSGPCVFSQRQGYVTIRREDGVVYDLSPVGETPGNYQDQQGRPVYRQSGLGSQGLIFRLPDESVYVYWQTAASRGEVDKDNPTAPYSTKDYDATTLLSCRKKDTEVMGSCPAGILRMDSGEASIVVTSPDGVEFTFNFMKTYVNAANREVEAELRGDTWVVTVDGAEVYEVPLAAIEGG